MLMLVAVVIVLLLLAETVPAQAGFLIGAVVGAIGLTGFAATAATFIGTIAIGFGLSYVASTLLKPKAAGTTAPTAEAGGAQLTIRMAADVPQSLLVGRAVTAGSRVHAATYGTSVRSQNSDLIEITALADHPCTALHAVFVEGQQRSLQAPSGDRGQVVDDYSGKLAIKFFDGAQTAADQFSVDRLSGASDNPWTADFIGIGRCYARQHSVYDQEKVPEPLEWKYVVDGIRLYDPRKDSTVSGGSGTHRYTNLATHEWTRNVAVIAYNILRGIYVADVSAARQFFFGLEGTLADQLPPANWFAAMNACDLAIDLDAGGTEPQFTAGGEITLDTEPVTAIEELLKACGGRLVELGGVFEIYIDAPGLPVLEITDGDLRADHEDQFRPVLTLEQRINHITATYTSPADGWIDAVAPPRSNSTWRTEDGRQKSAELTVPMVQSATQVQRLQQQLLNRSRRARKHVLPLPAYASVVRPGQVISWNSDRNGYEDKLFEVDRVAYEQNLNCTLSVTEVDPNDYDWAMSDELPVADGLIVTTRPAAKVIEGIDAEAFAHQGDAGTRRPAIRLTWDDPEDGDAIGVTYEIRAAADPSNVTSGSANGVDVVTAGELVILGGLQPVTEYEVRARFISANGYETTWTLWQPVLTPDTRTAYDLPLGLQDYIIREVGATASRLRDRMEKLETALLGLASKTWTDKTDVRSDLSARAGSLSASISEVATVAASDTEAVASQVTTVFAAVNDLEADVTTVSTAIATIDDKLSAAWTLKVDAHGRAAAIQAFADETETAIAFTADSFLITLGSADTPDDAEPAFLVQDVSGTPTLFFNGKLLANSIESGMIQADAITTSKLIADAALKINPVVVANPVWKFDMANWTLCSVSITSVTGKFVILSNIEFDGTLGFTAASVSTYYLVAELVLDNTTVLDTFYIAPYATGISGTNLTFYFVGAHGSAAYSSISAGSHTLSLRVRSYSSISPATSRTATEASIVAFEQRDNG